MPDTPIKPAFVLDVYMSTITKEQIDTLSSFFDHRWRQDSFIEYRFKDGYDFSEDGRSNPVSFLDSIMHESGVESIILLISW
jgi:hypothetical protein